jgi:hypothetical protein
MDQDRKRLPTILQEIQRDRLSRTLPRACPSCQLRFAWGWMEDELVNSQDYDLGHGVIRMQRIPRPDQTVFCPGCEARILN